MSRTAAAVKGRTQLRARRKAAAAYYVHICRTVLCCKPTKKEIRRQELELY